MWTYFMEFQMNGLNYDWSERFKVGIRLVYTLKLIVVNLINQILK